MNTDCDVDHIPTVLNVARLPNRSAERSADDFQNFFGQMVTESDVDDVL